MGFSSQNLYDFYQCRSFCHIMAGSQTCQNYSTESFKNYQIYVENLHCQRILTVGLLIPTVYLVKKSQFRLKLYFESSDFLVNVRETFIIVQKLQWNQNCTKLPLTILLSLLLFFFLKTKELSALVFLGLEKERNYLQLVVCFCLRNLQEYLQSVILFL